MIVTENKLQVGMRLNNETIGIKVPNSVHYFI